VVHLDELPIGQVLLRLISLIKCEAITKTQLTAMHLHFEVLVVVKMPSERWQRSWFQVVALKLPAASIPQ
jgi:hypothetical protein